MGNHSWLLAAIGAATLIVGCGQQTEDSGTESGTAPILTAETLGEQLVLSAEDYLAAAPYVTADRTQGERQAQICRACHSLEKGGPNMVGPGLHEFFGTKAGTRAGFPYSDHFAKPSLSGRRGHWMPGLRSQGASCPATG